MPSLKDTVGVAQRLHPGDESISLRRAVGLAGVVHDAAW